MLSISEMGDTPATEVDSVGTSLAINNASAPEIADAMRPYSGEDQERVGSFYLSRGGSSDTLELAFAILHDEGVRPRASKRVWLYGTGAAIVLVGSLVAISRIKKRRGRQ